MQKKLEKYLYKKYPQLFVNESKSMKETCMCWGCSCGDGWFFLLDRLCESITNHIKQQHERVDLYEKWEQEDKIKGKKTKKRPESAEEKIHQVHFNQVKEKFGALRIYHSGGDEAIQQMIDYTEYLSMYICEDCGVFGFGVGRNQKGWIHSTCKNCVGDDKDYIKSNGWAEIKSCSDAEKVWKRAMKDKEKNKGKEIQLTMKKIKELEKRSKGKNQQTKLEKQLWGMGHDHGIE